MSEEEIIAYYEGIKEGMWRYAWYKDGVQYVGTTGTTLKEAQEKVDKEAVKALERGGY